MTTIKVSSYVVVLGRALTERVDGARIELHKWLASSLAAPNSVVLREEAGTTKNLSFEDIHREASLIHDLVAPASSLEEDEYLILDLSAAPYSALRDPFLLQLATVARDRAGSSNRTIVILLSRVPPDNSAFWAPLSQQRERPGDATIMVICNSGQASSYGAERAHSDFTSEYRDRQAKLRGSELEHFKAKLLRRLGHFDLTRSGEHACGRFRYDASLCVGELVDILSHKLTEHFPIEDRTEDTKLVVVAGDGTWMEEACRIAADRSELPLCILPAQLPAVCPPELSQTGNILAADVVHTGATLKGVLAAFKSWGIQPAHRAIIALCTKPWVADLPYNIELDVIHEVGFEVTPRTNCPQCALGIPYADADLDSEPYVQVKAFDFWDMALRSNWGREPYSGQGSARYEYDPDFRGMFREFGDWIAFRYELVLRRLGFDREAIIICPEEDAILELVARLRARMEGRLVSVAIPRQTLDESHKYSEGYSDPGGATRRDEKEWERQLRYLNRSKPHVVFIDEFISSGKTRADALRILRAHNIHIAAHIPFAARSPEFSGEGVETIPLYHLASPRP